MHARIIVLQGKFNELVVHLAGRRLLWPFPVLARGLGKHQFDMQFEMRAE